MQLKSGTHLQNGKYKIERVLGQGGFGITYLATQELLDRKVCIKEFFFKEYCERDEATSHVSLGTQNSHEIVERFMAKFLKEARTISQLEHPNIIKIFDIFKENNTAYYVMEYIEGESLSDKVNHYGVLSELEAKDYINQVASALEYIHYRSINHLDIKPANIMVRQTDNKAILIDFGLSKQYDAQGGQTSTTPVGISHGYAPMEQYNVGGVNMFSPQTDIYSLGATLYKLLTGNTPPQAAEVLNEGLPELPNKLSYGVKTAITKAMQVRKKDRPENVKDFLDMLGNNSPEKSNEETKTIESRYKKVEDESTKVLDEPVLSENMHQPKYVDDRPKPTVTIVSEKESKDRKSGNKIWIMVLVIVVLAGVIGYIRIENEKEEKAMIEAYQMAQAQKQEAYNAMMADKMEYIQLIGEGDILLNNKKYSESINKYKQAQVFEIKYSNTEYSLEFNEEVNNKIDVVNKAKQNYEAEQARLEKERRKRAEEERKAAEYNRTHGKINGHDWVDLGLPSGIKWATCNVGAYTPESYGNYYAWGETETKTSYSSGNSLTYGKNFNDIAGNPLYDAARANWGGSWRLPTYIEIKELKDECIWDNITQGGKKGYKVTGPNGNSIFLPAAGYLGSLREHYGPGVCGYYWTSTPWESYNEYWDENAYDLKLGSSPNPRWCNRGYGQTIRPVSD